MILHDFWRTTTRLPRVALACAAVALALNLGSWAGLTMDSAGGAPMLVHVVVMGLGFALFVRTGTHHRLAWRNPSVHPGRAPVPAALAWATAIALVYCAVMFALPLAEYGEGAPELRDGVEVWVVDGSVVRELAPGTVRRYGSLMLRTFSATWLGFALLIAVAAHKVTARIEGYRRAAA